MGDLRIGNETDPFPGEAKITLHGKRNDPSLVTWNDAIEGGNKLLVNTANVTMYGLPRTDRTRLRRTANTNDTSILVEPGLDWVPGDLIALHPTTLNWYELDQVKVVTYDSVTGNVTIDRKLLHYHYGELDSTASRYNGVDIRGEVMLLTRNIKIQGE